jgi:hypothetical protein
MSRRSHQSFNTLTITAEPILSTAAGEPESNYTLFRLQLAIDGRVLTEPVEDLTAVCGTQLWLSQRYNRRSWPLTCTCGVPECAGFDDPVQTSRAAGALHWRFPVGYFAQLRQQGLVTGRPRAVDYYFDAASVYQQFEAVLAKVRAHELTTGQPSGFEAGCHMAPRQRLEQQLAHTEAWYLKRNKSRRFARHIGTPAGRCAGAPTG